MSHWHAPTLTFVALGLFWLAVSELENHGLQQQEKPADIVIAPPSQVLLYVGDRFLAANIEAIRAAAASTVHDAESFRLRAHLSVSRLNPCHEDNYWIGNASLSWGGAEEEGFELLRNAMHCRNWDEWPAFFYGFNKNFFHKDLAEARRALEAAAQRSPHNAAAFRNFSIMLTADEIDDIGVAIEMLKKERDETKDSKLRSMLDNRIVRLNGLQTLRQAQATYEKKFDRALENSQEIIESGILEAFPDDPIGIGYEFRNKTFHLRQRGLQR